MTKHRMFRLAPAVFAAALAIPGLALPGIAAAQVMSPTMPAMTPSARESLQAPVPTAPPNTQNATPAPARRVAQATRPAPVKPTDRVEGRIADLHTRLKITPVQSPQWDAFAGVMRDNARGMETAFDTRTTGRLKMTAVENMQSYATLAEQHAQDLRKLAPAFASLYGVMSDDQKRNADEVFRTERPDAGPRRRR